MLVQLLFALISVYPGAGPLSLGSLLYSQLPDENECILVCIDSVDVFNRPDSSAVFVIKLAPDNQVVISGRTVDGWLGFDPGVAQAANIGSFRLRWISGDAQYVTDGVLSSVPVVWGPKAGITYAMIYESSPLYSEPDTNSAVVDSVPSSSAAGIVSRTEDWYLLDLSIGPLGQNVEGWIRSMDVSASGDLDTIPLTE
ncbi:hypothetical protein DRQ25_07425 [Candidatus Fermentibacteria bacterium]|nr:MAG: hypothetical protein DRQ25_07425 [Candidatus Fermentibacteria bacterium]